MLKGSLKGGLWHHLSLLPLSGGSLKPQGLLQLHWQSRVAVGESAGILANFKLWGCLPSLQHEGTHLDLELLEVPQQQIHYKSKGFQPTEAEPWMDHTLESRALLSMVVTCLKSKPLKAPQKSAALNMFLTLAKVTVAKVHDWVQYPAPFCDHGCTQWILSDGIPDILQARPVRGVASFVWQNAWWPPSLGQTGAR